MKKSKLVSLLALVGCSLGLAACGQPTPTPTPSTGDSSAETSSDAGTSQDVASSEEGSQDVASSEDAGETSSESIEEKDPVFSFTGSSVIDEENYDCALECYDDNTFALKVGTVGRFEGTYRLIDKVGYEFTFTQTREVLLTTYDATTHKHSLTYVARLGEYGSGPVTLTYEDAAFVFVQKNAFLYGVTLRGTSSMILGTKKDSEGHDVPKTEGVSLALKLDVDGKAHLLANRPEELTMDGTYTFTNNTFNVTFGAQTFTSVYDYTNGAYTLPVKFELGEKYDNQKIETSLRYEIKFNGKGHGLTDATNIMGSMFAVTLTLDDHGNALFDGYTVNPLGASMGGMPLDSMFDRKGTYKMLDDGNVAVTVVNDAKRPGGGGRPRAEGDAPAEPEAPKTTTFTSTKENGVYTLVYKLGGSDGNFVFNLTGTDLGLPQGLVGKTSITVGESAIPLDVIATFNGQDKSVLVRVNIAGNMGSMNGHWEPSEDGKSEVYVKGVFDREGTYEVVDGVTKVTIDGVTVDVVWDDAAGTYTMPFTEVGQQGTINATLKASVYR